MQCFGDRRNDEISIFDRGEVDEVCAVWEISIAGHGNFERQPRFTYPAGARHRQEAHVGAREAPGHLSDIPLTSDQRRRAARQAVRPGARQQHRWHRTQRTLGRQDTAEERYVLQLRSFPNVGRAALTETADDISPTTSTRRTHPMQSYQHPNATIQASHRDEPYRFGWRPRASAPYPFNTRQYARLLILRGLVHDGLVGADDVLCS